MIDRNTEGWSIIEKWAKAELEEARATLEIVGLPQHATENLRGRIETLKDLLDLPQDTNTPAISTGYIVE